MTFTDRVDDAEAAYLKTIRFNPYHAKAHYNLANILQDRGDAKQAISHFLTSTQVNPLDVDTIVSLGKNEPIHICCIVSHHTIPCLGLAHKQDGNIHEAIRCCMDGIYIDNTNIFAVYNLAVIYQDLGQSNDAIIQYMRVLELDSNHIDSYINLSLLYQDIAMKETMPLRLEYLCKAHKCYDKILSIDSTAPEVHQAARKLEDTINFYQMFEDEDHASL